MWHSQIDKITQEIDSGIGAINWIRPFVPPATLRYIYNALEQPHFNYCSVVWEIVVERNLISYKNFRSVPGHIVGSSSYDADARCLLQRLGWKDLIAQRQIQQALIVFKALNNLAWLTILYVYGTHRVRLCHKGLYK